MIVVLFGVAGSGKSTIGMKLASAMNCAFLEGDALHPPANIDKMSAGTPLEGLPFLDTSGALVCGVYEHPFSEFPRA